MNKKQLIVQNEAVDLKCLADILGDPDYGPSISFRDKHFVLYEWSDAPSAVFVICRSKTINGLIEEYKKTKH